MEAVIPRQISRIGERLFWPIKRHPRRQLLRLKRVVKSRPTVEKAVIRERLLSGQGQRPFRPIKGHAW